MEHLEGIRKLAENEFAAIVQNGKFRSREEIDSVYKLMDIVKDIECVERWEEEDGDYDDEPRYSRESYARGRRNARRDSMGRYSRDRYSYDEMRPVRGYSRDGKDEYKDHLRELYETAPDEQTRQSIKRMMDNMS